MSELSPLFTPSGADAPPKHGDEGCPCGAAFLFDEDGPYCPEGCES